MGTEYISITMHCPDLLETPHFSLPTGFSIRTYRPGDEATWTAIQSAADKYNTITPGLFEREFGSDPAQLATRQLFLLDEAQQPIGTSTAWFGDDKWGAAYGRVHWVAIVPAFQGRGLAKPLMSATCEGLKAAGHERAYLMTDSKRVIAMGVYRQFGFEVVEG